MVDDLDLAVLLLFSVDLLEHPSDRMADDLVWWRGVLGRAATPTWPRPSATPSCRCSRRCAAPSDRSSRSRTTTGPARC